MGVAAKRAATKIMTPTWMVKASDITEVKYAVACSNTTTKTGVPHAPAIELVEVSETGMQLRLPVRSCAYGHMLKISIERRRSKPFAEPLKKDKAKKRAVTTTLWTIEDKIQFTAKVLETEAFGATMLSVTVQFYQCDQDHWREFLGELTLRQKSVTCLVRRMAE